jgi:hypothetical protein
MQSSNAAFIKTDQTGRVRTPVDRRASLLEEFDRSGLSGPKFAALAGIKYQTFATWMRKRRLRQAGADTALPGKPAVAGQWWETVVEQALPGEGLVLVLPGGIRAEIRDERQAALAVALIRTLAQPC